MDSLTRIAIVNNDKCKPQNCRQECARQCPQNRLQKLCIEVKPNSKVAQISEVLCVGCGICVKKCPFGAIDIINLPKSLNTEVTHRYGRNTFKLHRLPTPRPNEVLGLVGSNGTGKSTALKILAGKLKPNLGKIDDSPDWKEILTYFRGSELQTFFTKQLDDKLVSVIKPQHIDQLRKIVVGTVRENLDKRDERDAADTIINDLDLTNVLDKQIDELSGGELQRFAIAAACCKKADIYIFDEPGSYLDVRQRLAAAKVIRSLIGSRETVYIIVVEHDLALLDYLSDFVCVLYGTPGAYGVVTLPFSVREGINIFLSGWLPTENLRFREKGLTFKVTEDVEDEEGRNFTIKYPPLTKTLKSFSLTVDPGSFKQSEIIVMLGENGMGKTTFIRLLAGLLQADNGNSVPKINVSYKPQLILPQFEGTVRQILQKKVSAALHQPQFITDVLKPLDIEALYDFQVKLLSGGEMQRVALTLALGTPADVYLIDEPSAYLDAEQRLIAARCIKRFIMHAQKTAFIVEHDLLLAQYLANSVIVFEGVPAKSGKASASMSLVTGMNVFLKQLNITYRRDPNNFRPRINKLNSQQDQEQKAKGTYFFLDE